MAVLIRLDEVYNYKFLTKFYLPVDFCITLHCEVCHCLRWLCISHITSVLPPQSPSHGEGVGVLYSGSIIQHSHLISHDSGRVSGPSDSGSRSTSGDTGEGELRAGSIEVRVHSQCHTTWYGDVSWDEF